METRPPTPARILIAVGFAVSCFGIALFLWLAFGGPIPLKPEGYRVSAPFDGAAQLATEADVRISGVPVGKVKRVDLDSAGLAEATLELDNRYAPIPSDTRAILRQKTLLGETYVELTPGSGEAPPLADGGALPRAQVADTVQLDEIFRAFDRPTRVAFEAWMQGQAAALRGRGEDLSVAIASLPAFAEEANRLLRVLDSERLAVRELVRGGGEVFGALAERRGQLSGLIENAEAVFDTTARRNEELADAFTLFPTFLRESRQTLTRLERFATDTDPVVTALRPAARELRPTLAETGRLSPELEGFFDGWVRTIRVGPDGFAALRRLLRGDLPPLLERLDPWLAQLNPILEVVGEYRREVTSLLGNLAAASNGLLGFDPRTQQALRYLRTEAPLGPEALAAYGRRLGTSRTNPYPKPGGYLDVATGMRSFETRQCASGVHATLDPATASDPTFLARVDDDPDEAQELFDRIRLFALSGELDTARITPPPCVEQGPFDSIGSSPERSDYLHVRESP